MHRRGQKRLHRDSLVREKIAFFVFTSFIDNLFMFMKDNFSDVQDFLIYLYSENKTKQQQKNSFFKNLVSIREDIRRTLKIHKLMLFSALEMLKFLSFPRPTLFSFTHKSFCITSVTLSHILLQSSA